MARFLFLQGNATPFWRVLARGLATRGHHVGGIYLNAADRLFGGVAEGVGFRGRLSDWPAWLSARLEQGRPDAIMLFGRYRPHHRTAIEFARARGIVVWHFDEGYWRPGYVACECILPDGAAALPCPPAELARRAAQSPAPPAAFFPPGRFAERAAYDVLYHVLRVALHPLFPFYRPHHAVDPFVEYLAYVPNLLLGQRRRRRGQAVLERMRAAPTFLYPMQMEGDFQVRVRSRFASNLDALCLVLASFARAAPPDAILAIKAHPLDPGIRNWARDIGRAARRFDLAERVFYFHTDQLDRAVRACRGIVTINSTVGTLGLALGKPVLVLGDALYAMAGLTYDGDTDHFWTNAPPPNPAVVEAFRRVLSAGFLVPGDFFSSAGRQAAAGAAIARIEALHM